MRTRGSTPIPRPASTAGLILLLAAALAACDRDPTSPVSRPPLPAVASVEVSAGTTELTVGGSVQLTATPRAADHSPLAGLAVAWSSSDTSRVTVSASGVVTARATGAATVYALSGGRTGRLTLTVAPPQVASVRITPVDTVLEVGSSRLLRAEALAADGSPIPGLPVIWHSTDPAAVTVDAGGRATALREGIQVVNAEIAGKTGWARLIVPPDLSGEWRLSVYELEGGGTRCRLEGMRLTFTRQGLTLAGEAHPDAESGIRADCDVVGGEPPFSTPMPPNGPFAGTLTPAVAVAFLDLDLRFEYDGWHFRGSLIGDAVTGKVWLEEETGVREGRFIMTKF